MAPQGLQSKVSAGLKVTEMAREKKNLISVGKFSQSLPFALSNFANFCLISLNLLSFAASSAVLPRCINVWISNNLLI